MKGKRVSRRLAAAIQLNEALLEMQVVIASLFEENSWGMCIRGLIVRGGLWFKKKLFGDKSNTKFNMHCIIYCFKSFSGQGGLGENVSSVPS